MDEIKQKNIPELHLDYQIMKYEQIIKVTFH